MSAAAALCADRVFPVAEPPGAGTAHSTFERLAMAHRHHVDAAPDRFDAILEVTAASLFGCQDLRRLVTARNLRERRAVTAHLWLLRTRGLAAPSVDLNAVACGFVDVVVGIEMCHVLDGDARVRAAGYREAVEIFSARLTP